MDECGAPGFYVRQHTSDLTAWCRRVTGKFEQERHDRCRLHLHNR
jgi:hypothetical protein